MRLLRSPTSVHDVVVMQIVDRVEDLSNRLRGVLFREFSLLADTIEELASGRKLSYNIVFVLVSVSFVTRLARICAYS